MNKIRIVLLAAIICVSASNVNAQGQKSGYIYMQSKQQELLAPVYQRVMDAIRTVAKNNGYGFVYNQEALLVAPPADNLLPLVAKQLNVKLPAQGAANNAPGVNPGTKPTGRRQ
ncbi:MAG: hypothetical protein EON98_03455 [Chitinophagaceae bacterium]|nr:MAG: hypothetical protein EON98_03455 [Chitinophagaceae bacterium]